MKKVADIMTREVVTTEASKTVVDAAKVMAAQGVGCLLVVNPAKKAVGIITERDLVSRGSRGVLRPQRRFLSLML